MKGYEHGESMFRLESPPRVEPSAEVRGAAKHMRQTYVALVDEGFTPGEALALLAAMLSRPMSSS